MARILLPSGPVASMQETGWIYNKYCQQKVCVCAGSKWCDLVVCCYSAIRGAFVFRLDSLNFLKFDIILHSKQNAVDCTAGFLVLANDLSLVLLGDADIRARGDLAGHEKAASSHGNAQNENNCCTRRKNGNGVRYTVPRRFERLIDSIGRSSVVKNVKSLSFSLLMLAHYLLG